MLRKGNFVEDKEIVSDSCRLVSDHFQAGLLCNYEKPGLLSNLELAKRRLECLKKSSQKNCDG